MRALGCTLCAAQRGSRAVERPRRDLLHDGTRAAPYAARGAPLSTDVANGRAHRGARTMPAQD